MFTKRIIPCLDVNDGRVVKGVNFVNLIDAGDPVAIAEERTSWCFLISLLLLMREIQWQIWFGK